jgi:hypothetical protein
LAAAGAVAAAASVLWMLRTPTNIEVSIKGGEQPLEVGSWVASERDRGLTLAFSDGSEVNLERNSEVRLQELKDTGANLLLERGRVDVSVVHRKKTKWRVDVGPYHIRVTGTRFSADWLPEKKALKVAVREGTVIVDGPMLANGKALSKGDDIYASLSANVVEISKKDTYEKIMSKAVSETTSGGLSEALQGTASTTGAQAASRAKRMGASSMWGGDSWRGLATRGDYAEAVSLAEKAGFSKIVETASLRDLMLLGDAARLARKHARAVHVYKTVRRRYSHTAEAERAAFALGRISFEAHGRYREAAKWFERCYRDNPRGTMAREAAGRLMEALERAGDSGGAKTAAKLYQKRFANGPHAKLAKQILSKTTTAQ